MRAIKIDPAKRTIEEIELTVDPNKSLGELRSIIGTNCLQLILLDTGICLLAAAVNELDAGFGFEGGDLVIRGIAVVLGGSWKRLRALDEGLRSAKVSPGTVSDLNQKIYGKIEEWRMRPIEGEHPYVFVDGVYLKRSWGGEVQNVSVLVAVGVDSDGYREILGVAEGSRKDKESWQNFLRYLNDRGLHGVKLVVSDKSTGLVEALGDFFPEAEWQRCVVHWYRNAFAKCPKRKIELVAAMLKAIHAQEDKDAARQKAALVAEKLRNMKLDSVAEFVEKTVEETLSYMSFPREHWTRLRTNNSLERIMKEIRRRTRVMGAFPDGNSALMLVGARLRHITTTKWGTKPYLATCNLYEEDVL